MRLVIFVVLVALGFRAAVAAECGSDRLGTSRVLEVGTEGGLKVGLKTYDKTLPLADHEVILTLTTVPTRSSPRWC